MIRKTLAVASLLVLTACKPAPPPAPPPPPEPQTARAVMAQIVAPAALDLWDNQGTVDDKSRAPTTEDGWAKAVARSQAIIYGGDLILKPEMNPRADRPMDEWVVLTKAMQATAQASEVAALAKDPDKLFSAGGDLYEACQACHVRFRIGGLTQP